MCRTAIRSRRIARCARFGAEPGRARRGFPVRPRGSRSPRRDATVLKSCRLPPRSGDGRCDLCARIAARSAAISTCSMCRSGRARASAAASWRATCSGLSTEIVGVQSTEAPSYALSFAAGTVVRTNSSNTRADGMATRVPDAEALAIIRKGASRIVQVTDDEIAAAIRAYWTDTHNLAEGAGAAAARRGPAGKGEAPRQAGRPDPDRRQYRFRSVSEMDRQQRKCRHRRHGRWCKRKIWGRP